MKTRIAMMISIAGVLVAGSAAALVNTQVLGGGSSSSALGVDAAPQTSQSTPATTPEVPTTSVAAPAPAIAPTPPTAVAAVTQGVYAIGSAGSVTLDTAGDVLTILNVSPTSGWTVTKSENQDTANVEIKLQSGTIEADFHANLLFGVVTTSVQSVDGSKTTVSVDDKGGSGSGRRSSHGGGSDD
jgi:hypothetical protein